MEHAGIDSACSALLAAQLLTMGTRFNVQEFWLLAELELECRELPADDVEQCLLHLRREARSLDISKAEDREKLHHIVRTFFASPERKYPDELARVGRELVELRSSSKEREERATLELARIERETSEKLKKLDDQRVREVSAIQRTMEEQRRGWHRARVRLRLTVIGVCYLTVLVACVQFADAFGAGNNLPQKIGDTWWLFGMVTAMLPFAVSWWCRGELWPHANELLGSLGRDESDAGED